MKRKCIICDTETEFYFNKNFNDEILKVVKYYKCPNCGFVFSDTHYSMSKEEWKRLNFYYHLKSYDKNLKNFEHKPPYVQQALFLHLLSKNNLIPEENWLDYGAGLGNFEMILNKYFNLKIDSYDRYLAQENYIKNFDNKTYNVVFSSAVLEHLSSIEALNKMLELLSDDGVFIFHTLVCENIPQKSDWFYLLPFHCSFFTNKSMNIFMKKNNFNFCIYSPIAKTWALFKEKPENIKKTVDNINTEIMANYFICLDNFVDYWKGFS